MNLDKETLEKLEAAVRAVVEAVKKLIRDISDLVSYAIKTIINRAPLPYSYPTYHFIRNEYRKYNYIPTFRKHMPYCRRCY